MHLTCIGAARARIVRNASVCAAVMFALTVAPRTPAASDRPTAKMRPVPSAPIPPKTKGVFLPAPSPIAAPTPGLGRSGFKGSPAHPAPRTASSRVPARVQARTQAWHAIASDASLRTDDQGRAMLVLRSLNRSEHTVLRARDASGGFDAESLDQAAHVLRDASGNEHPIEPRLIDVVYRIQTHFGAPEIRVLSGYRSARGASSSNHGKGRAIDFIVPGVRDDEVAKVAREQGFTGVGIYPVSGFVHVDVRDKSYFWVDSSGPGKRGRIRPIFAALAAHSDARAAARGEPRVLPFGVDLGSSPPAFDATDAFPDASDTRDGNDDINDDHTHELDNDSDDSIDRDASKP